MWHFSSKTAKRTTLWSSSPCISGFWSRKKMDMKEYHQKKDKTFKPTKKYLDKRGRARWQGTSDLTKTGYLVVRSGQVLFSPQRYWYVIVLWGWEVYPLYMVFWARVSFVSCFFLEVICSFLMVCTIQPRQYTRQFGSKLLDLYRFFQPNFYKKHPFRKHGDPFKLFQEATFEDRCEDAMLIPAIVYLKGCKGLRVPEAWRPLLPTEL